MTDMTASEDDSGPDAIVPDEVRPARRRPARRAAPVGLRTSGSRGAQVARQSRGAFTPAKQRRFFEVLRETANISLSARTAGISPETVWRWRRTRPEFLRAWEQAIEEAYAALEMRMLAQAQFGETSESETSETETGKRSRSRRDSLAQLGRILDGHAARVAEAARRRAGAEEEAAFVSGANETLDDIIIRLRKLIDEAEGAGERGDAQP